LFRSQADEGGEALEVAVTGHRKGGALAPTVALWLRAALESMDAEETRQAIIHATKSVQIAMAQHRAGRNRQKDPIPEDAPRLDIAGGGSYTRAIRSEAR
jgi:hypothetical protein